MEASRNIAFIFHVSANNNSFELQCLLSSLSLIFPLIILSAHCIYLTKVKCPSMCLVRQLLVMDLGLKVRDRIQKVPRVGYSFLFYWSSWDYKTISFRQAEHDAKSIALHNYP